MIQPWLLFAVLLPAASACDDFESHGCRTRAAIQGFCASSWGAEHCCATCSMMQSVAPPQACVVPTQKCVTWSCSSRSKHQPFGASCIVRAKRSEQCQRCSVVDSDTCHPFVQTNRTCRTDGTWDGVEPSCRGFCDKGYAAPVEELTRTEVSQTVLDAISLSSISVVDIAAPPHGDFLVKKGLNKFFSKRIDVFGHFMVLFTKQCAGRWGTGPSLGVANQYAQWIDWDGTGKPNNPRVWAQLLATNATMVMFKEDGNREQNRFNDKYPFDEDPFPDHHWFHPHDTGCDETPHADPEDNNTFDNAYCEVVQQLFNEGYRPAFPEVFLDQKGSKVANAMDKNIGDCGHAYDNTFKYPHCTGKYHYSDKTCDYQCLFSEYEYWALTSILGGQDGHLLPPLGTAPKHGRCQEIADEWESCTKDLIIKNDPDIYAIMTDAQYGLPTKLAYGKYEPNAVIV